MEQIKNEGLKRQIDGLFKGGSMATFKKHIETIAKTGNIELVRNTLEYFCLLQEARMMVIAASENSLWKLVEVAEKYKASLNKGNKIK